jgi:aspartate ammonia-lyase
MALNGSPDLPFLAQIPLFQNLNTEEISILHSFMQKKIEESQQVIFSPGDPRDRLRLIVKGRIHITPDGGSHPGTTTGSFSLGPHQFLGEITLLQDDFVHTSQCKTTQKTEFLLLYRSQFQALTLRYPELAGKIIGSVSAYIAERLSGQNTLTPEGSVQLSYRSGRFRTEYDLLGERKIPENAYYGVQTLRAIENFSISKVPLSYSPTLIKSFAQVKKAAALANHDLGLLDSAKMEVIGLACDELCEGHWLDQFRVDMIQGGAGTSTNMNVNEVIANRALELLGHFKGEYQHLHPNNHVNMGQSTNDVYPTAVRVSVLHSLPGIISSLQRLCESLAHKSKEFESVIKMGRTQLQDAVPMTLGQEFEAFRINLEEEITRLKEAAQLFCEVNLGGTAIGTGLNAHPDFAPIALKHLKNLTQLPLKPAANFIEATVDTGAFVTFSGALKRTALKLSKLCNDLRLLSSGPRCGLGEINLPPMQPGSSIMPGKVNPVIPEVVNQVAFQVMGNDLTISMASEAGQLQLNVMEPVMVFNVIQSLTMLTRAIQTLDTNCIRGITANPEVCREMVENSIGIITALNPHLGYENTSKIAKEALETRAKVTDLILKYRLIDPKTLENLLLAENMVGKT